MIEVIYIIDTFVVKELKQSFVANLDFINLQNKIAEFDI